MLDCVVVGAGIAGLAAARDLVNRGKDIIVVEARNRVGGRVETMRLTDGTPLDLGGEWVSEGQELMSELLDRYQVRRAEPVAGDLMVRMGGQTTRVHQDSPSRRVLSPFQLSDLGQGLHRFRRLGQRMARDAAWADANSAWLGQPLLRWVESNLRTSGGQGRFLEAFTHTTKAQADEITLRDGLARSAESIDMEALVAVEGGFKQFRMADGLGTLPDAMATELGDRLLLDSQVDEVRHDDRSVTVVTADGDTIVARQAIVTIPPHLAVGIHYEPALDPWRAETADKVPAGHVIKAFLIYPRPWWRDAGLGGQLSADEGTVRVTFDTSPASGVGVLMGFFEGEQAATLGARTEQLRQLAFQDVVTQVLGAAPEPAIEYVERDWLAEPFTGGCHGAHFAPGIWTNAGSQLGQPEGRIHFAGAEYATKFNGYLEGAVHSAKETVAVVARSL